MAAEPARPAPVGKILPGRLTAELILRSPQYMSCLKLYEVDLRGEGHQPAGQGELRSRRGALGSRQDTRRALLVTGNKISAIENLGATQVGPQRRRTGAGKQPAAAQPRSACGRASVRLSHAQGLHL